MPHDLPTIVRPRAQPQGRISFQQRLKEIDRIITGSARKRKSVRREKRKQRENKRRKKGKPDPVGVTKFTVQCVVKELITVLRIERMRATKLGENREVEETSKEKAELEKGSHHFIDDHTERPPVDGKSVVEIE